jgi:hypothetical protein
MVAALKYKPFPTTLFRRKRREGRPGAKATDKYILGFFKGWGYGFKEAL